MSKEEKQGISRRGFVKGAFAIGSAALVGSLVTSAKSIVPPRIKVEGEVKDTFIYAKATIPLWYDGKIGKEARVEDFQVGRGASTIWRGIFDEEGRLMPSTGLPAILLKVDPAKLQLPEGFNGHIDGLVAFYDRCTHLCCTPGWKLDKPPKSLDVTIVAPERVTDPTFGVIFCVCHNSQFDPLRIVENEHPVKVYPNPVKYLGANWVFGPAQRALPIIPIRREGLLVVGEYANPEWYDAYCV